MDNNKTYELENIENNSNNKEDIVLEEDTQAREGSLYLPTEVDNYLSVRIYIFLFLHKYKI